MTLPSYAKMGDISMIASNNKDKCSKSIQFGKI